MKVVVAMDNSPYSKHVLDCVCRRKWPADTQFKIVSVIEPIDTSIADKLSAGDISKSVEERRILDAERLCGEARHNIEQHVPLSQAHFEIRKGDARTEIIEAAAHWNADRIMVGAKGSDICSRSLLGSVSRDVTQHAHCSVEVVRPGHHEVTNQSEKKAATTST